MSYMDMAFCNLITLGIQPSEIKKMEWREYLTIMLGETVRHAQCQEHVPLSTHEQMAIACDAMDILTNGPTKPAK